MHIDPKLVQVTVWDSGYNSSDVLNLNISVTSVNDERPRLASTALTVIHREGAGPTNLLGSTATLYDDDNCPEHRLVSEIRLRVASFIAGEDVLLDGEGREINLNTAQDGIFGFGSGFASGEGDWESVGEQYVTFTCDQALYPECYNNLLRSLQYNNTAEEPSTSNHTITIEVCEPNSSSTCLTFVFISRWKTEEGMSSRRKYLSRLILSTTTIHDSCWMAEMVPQTTKSLSWRVRTTSGGQSLFYYRII